LLDIVGYGSTEVAGTRLPFVVHRPELGVIAKRPARTSLGGAFQERQRTLLQDRRRALWFRARRCSRRRLSWANFTPSPYTSPTCQVRPHRMMVCWPH